MSYDLICHSQTASKTQYADVLHTCTNKMSVHFSVPYLEYLKFSTPVVNCSVFKWPPKIRLISFQNPFIFVVLTKCHIVSYFIAVREPKQES